MQYQVPFLKGTYFVVSFSVSNHLFADIDTNFVYHSEDISFSWWCIRAKYEIWATKGVEVYGMVCTIKGRVKHLSDFLDNWSRFNVEKRV